MKILFFLLCIVLPLSNLPGQNPDKKITLKTENENLKTTLSKISEQTAVSFIYSDSLIRDISVSCNFKDINLDQALNNIFKSSGLTYRKSGNNQIVIFKKPALKTDVIAGYILDGETSESLPYANIMVKGTKSGTIANNSGHFTLADIPQEVNIIHVQYIGYRSKDILIDTLKYVGDNLLIKMQPSAITTNEINVHENSDMVQMSDNVSQFVISPRRFSNLVVIGDKDISRSLQLLPGISGANFGSSGLNIRGGLPSQNLILLDGIKLFHITHLFGLFSSFNSDAIKDARIYRGGYPAKYGDKLSGIIELTTKTGDLNRARLNVSLSQAVSGAVLELPLFGKGSILLSARRSYSDFVFGSLYDRVQRTLYSKKVDLVNFESDSVQFINSKSNLYFYDLLGKLTLLPSNSDIVTISYFNGTDHLNNKETVNREAINWKNTQSEWGNKGYSVNWYRQWKKDLSSNTLIAYSDYYTRYYMSDNSYIFYYNILYRDTLTTNSNIVNNVKNISVKNTYQWQLKPSHLIEFGFCFSNTRINYQLRNVYLNFASLSSKEFLNDSDLEKSKLYALFFQDSWNVSKDFKLNGGLRFNSYLKKYYPEPRFSLKYQLTPLFSFSSTWGRYYQYVLQYGDGNQVLDGRTTWVLANDREINPARADHFISGINYETEHYLINLEGYYKKIFDIPDALNEWQYLYSDQVAGQMDENSYGFDLILQKKTGWLSGWISYSYSKSENKIFADRQIISFPADQDNRHKFNIVSSYKIQNWRFIASWNYTSGKPYSIPVIAQREAHPGINFNYLAPPKNRNEKRLPSTHQLDLNVQYNFEYSFFKGIAGISMFDVYNRKNVWYRDFTINEGKRQVVEIKMFGFTPTFFLHLEF